jgi:hypothetical protein
MAYQGKQWTRAAALLALGLALGSGSAGAAALVGAPGSQPLAMAQHGTPAAFNRALERAVKSAGSRVDSTFVEQWFGPAVAAGGASVTFEYADETGSQSVVFSKEDGGWVKRVVDLGQAQAEENARGGPATRGAKGALAKDMARDMARNAAGIPAAISSPVAAPYEGSRSTYIPRPSEAKKVEPKPAK